MRLVRMIEKAEAAAAERRKAKAIPAGIIWSVNEVPYPGTLEAGQHIAVDLHLVEAGGRFYAGMRSVERVAAGPGDFGVVYDAAGVEAIGRVVSVEGRFVTIEWADGVLQPWRVMMGGDVAQRLLDQQDRPEGGKSASS